MTLDGTFPLSSYRFVLFKIALPVSSAKKLGRAIYSRGFLEALGFTKTSYFAFS